MQFKTTHPFYDKFVGVADILFQRSSGNKIYVISVIYLFTSYNVKGFCAGDGIFPLNCFEDSALLELKSLTFDFALFVHIQLKFFIINKLINIMQDHLLSVMVS